MKTKIILPLFLAALAGQVQAANKVDQPAATLTLLKQETAAKAQPVVHSKDGRSPLQLKFTAADGSPVDLSALRGHVVLIDFWATWCPPCMQEAPNVVAAYQKYHDRGFDVIGVSLDEDKQSMLSVTRSLGMTWPQYFDGRGWENKLAAAFGVQSIPAMWLVNKDGVVVSTDARGNLEPEIAKLLTE